MPYTDTASDLSLAQRELLAGLLDGDPVTITGGPSLPGRLAGLAARGLVVLAGDAVPVGPGRWRADGVRLTATGRAALGAPPLASDPH